MADGPELLTQADYDEVFALFDAPPARTAAPGKKRRKCKKTPMHPHCRSIRWGSSYRALRRKGMSKKRAAMISNQMYSDWRRGKIRRKNFT